MAKYRRVTYEDRCQIQAFLQAKVEISEIVGALAFHKSTIYRELARNRSHSKLGNYFARAADEKARLRYRRCRKRLLVVGDLASKVINLLMEGWSPEQISGRLRLEQAAVISAVSIYRFVYRNGQAFNACLKRYYHRGAGRLRMRRQNRSIGLSIKTRPEAANSRSRRGDWERDTFMVANRKLVLVCTDRKTRYTKIAKCHKFESKYMSRLTWKVLKQTQTKIHTITNDNGTEFRDGPSMKVPVYYCQPYKPQQRGTVENTIGLIRHYIKRKDKIESISEQKLRDVEMSLNLRPRKCLDYKTPYEVFFGKSVALAS